MQLTEQDRNEMFVVLTNLRAEGLAVSLREDGSPVIQGGAPSAGLAEYLRSVRGIVISWLSWSPREWAMPDGTITQETTGASRLWCRHDSHPEGALGWRPIGEEDWRDVPGAQS